MKNTITRVDALNTAISFVSDHIAFLNEATGTDEEIKAMNVTMDILTKIRDQIAKPRKSSDEAKAKAKDKRAKARTALMEQVLPIVRKGVADGGTAKEIFERCADALPADFTAAKVQYILLHEMADEVVKTEAKNKPNVYTMKG